MDKGGRFRIGIIFNFTQGWLGGVYYYQNIIKSLNFLPDEEKPEIIIFYNKEYAEHLQGIKYPYLQMIPWQFTGVYKGYLLSFLKGKNVFIEDMITRYRLGGIYPVNDNPVSAGKSLRAGTVAAAWFPDLQHKFFPDFFDKKRLWLRELRLKITLQKATDLVVSSNDTVNHFREFYRLPPALRLHVLQFVSILDEFPDGDIEQLRQLYQVPGSYFIVSNGFLKHKNHFTVLKALRELKQRGKNIHIVFTGRMTVYADPSYMDQLNGYIREHQLEKNLSLLGVIPRAHQVCLMKNATAVLQPSMFEGWNTTVEDAKFLQLPVIASGIAVHREQLGEKGTYFEPENATALADVLENFATTAVPVFYGNNEERIKAFARSFLHIFQSSPSTAHA